MATEPKRLYRSRQDKLIAGVCGGIAEYFVIDPIWVRLIALFLALANGVGIVLYIVAWILMPKNPEQTESKATAAEDFVAKVEKRRAAKQRHSDAGLIAGMILLIVGSGFLLKNLFSWFRIDFIWPTLIILLGIYILVRRRD